MVKWFDDAKGYGVLVAAADGSEVFVHYSGIDSDDTARRTLRAGQRVTFELAHTPRGVQADRVRTTRQSFHEPFHETFAFAEPSGTYAGAVASATPAAESSEGIPGVSWSDEPGPSVGMPKPSDPPSPVAFIRVAE
ncbi:cold-shock protein [Blastococcus sp. TF02A-26]|uniref:cold-shock protein n=1 Tax=Blastococcus sp. TF02A-26 TaxID=2250577 RepID=UPI000DE94140|nr:cold shock domain-containing protein [Blastococcus sp. TF02A-26]RBY79035.1 hypothetical protein DQ240_22770 [Blastococcus sp. TF02A-26]